MKSCEGILRQRVEKGEHLLGGVILDSRSSAIVEVYQEAGYDFAVIDREHTALNLETVADHIRTARCLSFPCLVRVTEDCYHELNPILDQAPDGIVVPRITSREQVERIVRTIKYQPEGIRGLAGGGCPAGKYRGWNSLSEQTATINRNLVVGIQIETAEALADLDGILSVRGVDIAVVGNDDLSLNMGIPGETKSSQYIEAVESIIAACRRHGVTPGIAAADPQTALFWLEKGMKIVWYSCDIYLIFAASRQALKEIRQGISA